MKSSLRKLDGNALRASAGPRVEGRILRLVKGAAERRAIEAGEVDAVMDPAIGLALLLPEAQAALRADEARVCGLLALSSDWSWEQDEFHRFVSHTGTVSGSSGICDESIIGKTLWDPPFDGISEADWQAHRRLLEWRATFRDFELRCTDRAGELRWVSVSGEPIFDTQDQFRGYRGTMRDITPRKWTEALAQKQVRLACETLDALAVQVWVLDQAGTVILANTPSGFSVPGKKGIGAVVPVGANYLGVCDKAGGTERVHGLAIAAGIRQVMAGESPLFRYEYARDPAAGRERFKVTVTAYPGDGTARVVVSCEYAGGPQGSEPVPREGMVRTGILPYNKMAERKRRERLRELDRKVAEGGPVANRLLAVLPRKDYRRLRAGFETVTLVRGMVLYEPGDRIRHVYFPIGSVVSLLTTVEGHEALEVGLVGREGMVGISLAVGMDVASVRAVVQGTGTAMRLESGRFRQELLQCRLLQNELHRYAHAKLAQARQIVACSCFHDVEERLACWLLMARDRVEGDQFFLTQEFLSQMLGVRREGVTRAAGRLHKRELIEFSRGYIRILDRRGLEGASCSCYRVFRSIHS